MNWNKTILIFLFFGASALSAQSLRGLQENQTIKKELKNQPVRLKSAYGIVISLPFFDDFSSSSVFPDYSKWADQSAFINNSFGFEPVSIGVATLDAIDQYGDVYTQGNSPVSSDELTSNSINLAEINFPQDTAILSFFYQCGGKGEIPDITDSLVVEFYIPSERQWQMQWFSTEHEASPFKQVIIELDSARYYQTGFKFRFRNVTSTSASEVDGGKGAVSNADVWNIDYVMMNTNPLSSHQYINDFTITDVPRRMLDAYETIPWMHLNEAQSITRNIMNFDIRNLNKAGDSTLIGWNYYVRVNGDIIPYQERFQNVPNDTLVHRIEPFLIPFTRSDNSTQGTFEVCSYLIAQAQQYLQNDTSKVFMHFKNSYAYDDGTPEYGFGIEGPSTNGALLAVKFRLFKADTLQAIEMQFNKARDNFNSDLEFRLCVWGDNDGQPGDLIYMSDNTYTPGLLTGDAPEFTMYPLNAPENIYISDTVVYIGWKQNTEEFLNLGYDVNRDNRSRTFVNISGNWVNLGASLIPGTLMMRAIFGNKNVIVSNNEVEEAGSISVYPNPAREVLNIYSDVSINHVDFIDISGRIIMQQKGNRKQMDISALSPGLYQVIVYPERSKPVIQKIIVTR